MTRSRVSPDSGEERVHTYRGRGRGTTRAALEIEERSGRRSLRRRQHRDSQGDLRAVRLPGVGRNGQAATPCVEIAAVRTGHEVRRAARRPPRLGAVQKPGREAERGDDRDGEQPPGPSRRAAARRPPMLTPVAHERAIRVDVHHELAQPRIAPSRLPGHARRGLYHRTGLLSRSRCSGRRTGVAGWRSDRDRRGGRSGRRRPIPRAARLAAIRTARARCR